MRFVRIVPKKNESGVLTFAKTPLLQCKIGFLSCKNPSLQHKKGVFGKWLIFRWLQLLYILKSYGATQGVVLLCMAHV